MAVAGDWGRKVCKNEDREVGVTLVRRRFSSAGLSRFLAGEDTIRLDLQRSP